MKVVLVNPVTKDGKKVLRVERCQQKMFSPVGIWPPVSLLEIATSLRSVGAKNVNIIDGEVEGLSFESLASKVKEEEADLVVMSTTTPTINDDLLFADLIKDKTKNISIAFTGMHATVFPGRLLKEDSVDYALMGEPEETASELLSYLSGKKGSIDDIKGLGHKKGRDIVINKKRPARDGYDYPAMPPRSLLKNEKYVLPLTNEVFTVIKVSRGCNFTCSFCTSRVYYGKGWRARSPENIVKEIESTKRNHGINTFLFLSDTFNGERAFVRKFLSLIIEKNLNIRWVSNSRLDLVDEEVVDLMKRSGCVLVSLGIESYDDGILEKSGKCLKSERIDKGIELFKKYDIKTYGYFIFGLEGETKRSMLKTAMRARKSPLDFAVFYSLTPYPGTGYFEKYGTESWEEYFHGTSNIVEREGLSKFSIKLFRYLATFLFYTTPKRIVTIIGYFVKGKLL
ncbi:B12-binding domain-containing radical SAM protein [Candidatus Omnitrophota bacterium]